MLRTSRFVKRAMIGGLRFSGFLAAKRCEVDNLSKDVAGLQEELIHLHRDQFHRQLLSTASLGEFWTSVKKEKPIIGNEAMTFLLPLLITYR